MKILDFFLIDCHLNRAEREGISNEGFIFNPHFREPFKAALLLSVKKTLFGKKKARLK